MVVSNLGAKLLGYTEPLRQRVVTRASREFLDGGGNWHSRITLFITNTWQGVNKRHLRHIFFDDGRVFSNMAEKTRAVLVDLLSSENSDTLEDPEVVVIRVTPPLIPSVYHAVGAITADRNHVPKYEPAYDVVRMVPHDLEYGKAPFDAYIRVNTECTQSVDWAAKCGWLKAQGPYRIVENTSPGHRELLECTGIVTFDLKYGRESSVVATWVSTSIQREILLGSKVLTELGTGINVVNQTDNNKVGDSLPPEPNLHPSVCTDGGPKIRGPFKAWCERQRRGESTDLTDEEGCWIPNKEWPKTPESGNWRHPRARSRIYYNGGAVLPEVWDSGQATVYYDPFMRPSKRVGWSQELEEVQFIPPRQRVDPYQHSEEIQILDGNDNPIPSKAAGDMVTTNDDESESTPSRQRTLSQGCTYTERDDPYITVAQFRQNNREIDDEDQPVILTDVDSSVGLASSVALSDSDGHGDCGRGGICPDDLDVAQVLFSGEDSEVESSNFSAISGEEEDDTWQYNDAESGQYDDAETDDEVGVVEDLKRA